MDELIRTVLKKSAEELYISSEQRMKDDVSNNLIECFNKQFKAWYKTKQGFTFLYPPHHFLCLFTH